MKRLFNEHEARNVIELSGTWKYKFDADRVGASEGWYNGFTDGETVIVPSCFNNELGKLNYEGPVWYQRKFYTVGGTLMLEFESVMTAATVWLDGNKIGYHYGAFTPFQFVVNNIDCLSADAE